MAILHHLNCIANNNNTRTTCTTSSRIISSHSISTSTSVCCCSCWSSSCSSTIIVYATKAASRKSCSWKNCRCCSCSWIISRTSRVFSTASTCNNLINSNGSATITRLISLSSNATSYGSCTCSTTTRATPSANSKVTSTSASISDRQ